MSASAGAVGCRVRCGFSFVVLAALLATGACDDECCRFDRRPIALIRGGFASFVREREERSPKAVYEQAILERQRHYAELKRAVAGILYMRNKLDGEIASLRGELARLHDDIRVALRRGDDEAALVLVRHKQTRSEELERAEQDLEKVRAEASRLATKPRSLKLLVPASSFSMRVAVTCPPACEKP